jgi:hypothetical protein
MHLFAPERPEITTGTKALRLDGSAIPHLLVQLTADGNAKIQVLLRRQDNYGGYGWHSFALPLDDIPELLRQFTLDPEQTLAEYFGWIDTMHNGPRPFLAPAAPATAVSEMEALL